MSFNLLPRSSMILQFSQLLKKKMCGLIFDVYLIKLHCRRGISSRTEQTLKFRRLPSANFKLEYKAIIFQSSYCSGFLILLVIL